MSDISQGGESNRSGKFLEYAIEQEFRTRGVLVKTWGEAGGNGDLFAPQVLWRNNPYKSIYGSNSVSEFLYQDFILHNIRIECRWQQVSGSVDEKLPYMFWNARDAMPELEVWIVIDGGGARRQAVDWLKKQASQVANKTIRVLSMAEARALIKRTIARDMAAA